jgi:hypothetical protein
MKIFARPHTKKMLTSPGAKAVYLYGSNMGYSNFGDILQLKNEAWYHSEKGYFTPVVVLRLNAPYGYSQEKQNLEWFDVEHICYIAEDGQSAPPGLVELSDPSLPHLLHVYGGGFLNSFWGKEMLGEITEILRALNCSQYLFSGQQVSEGMAKHIHKTLRANPPLVFGVRDKQSQEYMSKHAPSLNVQFSFDDITELLVAWASSQSSLTVKGRIKARLTSSVLWHFNTTGYVSGDPSSLVSKIQDLRSQFDGSAVLLQAYNDGSGGAKDTLQTVVQLENAFPYTSYKVLNLAQLALHLNASRAQYPEIAPILAGAKMAVTSSYHTAMLCVLLGIPSYLMVENEYYAQKQRALGLEEDFQKFVRTPKLKDSLLREQVRERTHWLNDLDGLLASL